MTQQADDDPSIRVPGLAWRMVESLDLGLALTAPDSTILYVNPALERITGYSAAELIGRKPSLFSSGQQEPAFYAAMWRHLLEHGRWEGELSNRRKDGAYFIEQLSIVALRNRDGGVEYYAGLFADISSRKEQEARILHQAQHDPLTGLPNRLLLYDRIDSALRRARHFGNRGALLFLDLDHFKEVNDRLGHSAGDHLLVEIATRLRRAVRDSDTVCRLGGDEFVVLLPEIDTLESSSMVADKLLQAIREPVQLGAGCVRVDASIGIAVFPDHGARGEDLLDLADQTMYRVKQSGRGRWALAGDPLRSGASG